MANTGYKIQPQLKRVTNDINEYPLDENDNLCSVTGLPQAVMANPVDDPTYKVEDHERCPIVDGPPVCPDRILVFQICNSNAVIDDNFNILLNGTLIGAVDLNAHAQIGSVFIGSLTPLTIVDADFACAIEDMVVYYFDPALVLGGTNEIKMINVQGNGYGNLGDIGIRNYTLTGTELSDPCVINDLFYYGISGTNFDLPFEYTDCCMDLDYFTIVCGSEGDFSLTLLDQPPPFSDFPMTGGRLYTINILPGTYAIKGFAGDSRNVYKNGVLAQSGLETDYVFTPVDGDHYSVETSG